ncbi:hypothetical protein B0H21DRAFT_776136 [Amylocystis lapponica]|nr:hypothetical protein B0H21DRAFT_776136 [Amylocystis lapponica]
MFLDALREHIRKYGAQFIARRTLARLLSTALCAIVIVVRPVSHLGGQYAFTALALKELVFNVQENLAQQLELTVLNIMGALLGIGFSTLAKYLASLYPDESARARTICAVFLVAISFFAGLARSRLTRLRMSTRISCFIATWLLTSNIGIRSHVLADSGDFLFVTLVPAILCLLSLLIVMSLLRWHSTNFEKEMATSFGLLHRCLAVSLPFVGFGSKEESTDPAEFYLLREQLFRRSINLNETYSQAAFELRVGRLSLKSIRPFIGIVEHIRRELAWGMAPIKPFASPVPSLHRSHSQNMNLHGSISPRRELTSAIEEPARLLGHAILDAMRAVECVILVTFQQSNTSSASFLPGSIQETVRAVEQRLLVSRDEARERLAHVFDTAEIAQQAAGDQPDLPKEVFDRSLAMIALLQMAQEMRLALQVARRIAMRHEESKTRLWYPRVSLQWLGVPPGPFISDDFGTILHVPDVNSSAADPGAVNAGENLTYAETRQALAERGLSPDLRYPEHSAKQHAYFRTPAQVHVRKRLLWSWGLVPDLFALLWSHRRVLWIRMWLSAALRAVQHSSHLRHAMKNAIGVALLSLPAFLPADSAGRRWFTAWHGQWMVISYLWVLETNTGATWRHGYLRILGTTLGAIYAYVAWLICKTNPYGLVIMVTVADIPITWLIVKTTLGLAAVPAKSARTAADYLSQCFCDEVLAIKRAVMIAAGMIAALFMNSLVFPRHCRYAFAQEDRRKTLKLELQIRNTLYRLSVLITTMHAELSLLPKPLGHYRKVVAVLQKLLDLMTGLRKIRENIPRKETVASVFNERREFMSCVCITLFACQHAFRAKEPLPQFLPSPRHAGPHAMGLSQVYAFAEQEAMKDMVDALEELLELSGRLFGTSAWLTQDPFSSRTSTLHDEGGHGWYSTFRWEEA